MAARWQGRIRPMAGQVLAGLLLAVLLVGCAEQARPDDALRQIVVARGLTGDPTVGRDLPGIDEPRAQLGKMLFFSQALSGDMDTACASCHHPLLGGADGLTLSIGTGAIVPERVGPGRAHATGAATVARNAPTTFNSGLWDQVMFHDGRVESLAKTPGANGGGPSGIRTPDTPYLFADPLAGPNLPAAQSRFPTVAASEMRGRNHAAHVPARVLRARLCARLGDFGVAEGELPDSLWPAAFARAFGSGGQSVAGDAAAEAPAVRTLAHGASPLGTSATGAQGPSAPPDPAGTAGWPEPDEAPGRPEAAGADARPEVVGAPARPEALITDAHIAAAIADYERSQVFVDTPWRAYVQGDDAALSPDAGRGALLFFRTLSEGGAGCASCHAGDAFTDERFYVLAVPQVGPGRDDGPYPDPVDDPDQDLGRFHATYDEADRYAFRTPSLLNVAVTGPYGHDGAYRMLEGIIRHHLDPADAVRHYDAAQLDAGVQTARMEDNTAQALARLAEDRRLGRTPLQDVALDDRQVQDLIAFLESLTDPCVTDPACLAPWLPAPGDPDPDGLRLAARIEPQSSTRR